MNACRREGYRKSWANTYGAGHGSSRMASARRRASATEEPWTGDKACAVALPSPGGAPV